MKIRLSTNTFIRYAGEESVVWCPRTGGCTVMRNARPILDEVKRERRSVDGIVGSVAAKFECWVEDVREGVEAVVEELVSQRFVEVAARAPYQDEDWTPLGDFYMRHGLPSELHIDLTDGFYYPCDGFHDAIIGDARKDSRREISTLRESTIWSKRTCCHGAR